MQETRHRHVVWRKAGRVRWACAAALLLSASLPSFSGTEYDLLPAPDKNGAWGYVSAKTGKTVIAPQYAHAGFFEDGVAQVSLAPHSEDGAAWRSVSKQGLIDRTGKEILPVRYDSVELMAPPRAEPASSCKKNACGKLSSSESSTPPAGGTHRFFKIGLGKQVGVFRADGRWLFPLGEYKDIRHIRLVGEDRVIVRNGDSVYENDRKYDPPPGYRIDDILHEAQAARVTSKPSGLDVVPRYGVVGFDGEWIIPPEYHRIQFVKGPPIRWVLSRADGGIVSKLLKVAGALMSGQKKDADREMGELDVSDKKDMLNLFLLDEKAQVIKEWRGRYFPDISGNKISYTSQGRSLAISAVTGEPIPEETAEQAGKYILFREKGLWGVRNPEGQVLIKPEYLSMGHLGGDLFSARRARNEEEREYAEKTGRYDVYAANVGVIDETERTVLSFEYTRIERAGSAGYPDAARPLLMVSRHPQAGERRGGYGDLYGIADRKGHIVVPLQYEGHLYLNALGQTVAYQDGKHGVIDHTGKIILPLVYNTIFDTQKLDKTEETFYIAQRGKRWGLYDATGKEMVPPECGYLSIPKTGFKQGWVNCESADRTRTETYNYRTKTRVTAHRYVVIYDVLVSRDKADSRGRDLVDAEGKVLGVYDSIAKLPNGWLVVRTAKGDGVLNARGKKIVPGHYRDIAFASGSFLWARDAGDPRKDAPRFLVDARGKAYRIP